MKEQLRLHATGRQQDLADLYARLANARRQVAGGNYEISLERVRVTARFNFFRVFYFGWFQQFSQELPALRLAVQNILRKMGVQDRTQAAVWVVKQGLV